MTQIERAYDGTIPFALMVVVLLTTGVFLWRSFNGNEPLGARSIASIRVALLTASVACVLYVTLLPAQVGEGGSELMPFTNLDSYAGRSQAIANTLLLIPTGFLYALNIARGRERPIRNLAAFAVLFSVGLEVAQGVLPIHRVVATEDVLIHVVGGLVGGLAAFAICAVAPRRVIAVTAA
ncbi:VanZ family protein [Nocardioides sp. GY 10113]|uniref:VanZ family protein n=1 Tax=Nocardioides sp. GY 10113 TaxID=2569761 RepID=UPI0010A78E8B|nr:VanZ family protein [Nocardioides sp. GY 10113]TIC89105.1 VanZ family protein [Nocardioides sp. GY 10113]